MDSILGLSWNLAALSLILPIVIFFIRTKTRSKPASTNWPPGPKTLPVIGNMHLLSALAFRSISDLAKQYGPLMRLKLGEVDTIVVSSRDLAREMLKQHDPCYADRPDSIGIKVLWYNYRDIAFSPYGDYWRQMRKICIMELLSPRSVRSFASIRRDEVSNLISSIRASAAVGEPVNISESIFSMMSSVTCRAAFGKVSKDKDTLIKILRDGIQMASGFEIADFFPSSLVINTFSWTKIKLLMMRHKLDVILDDLIRQHQLNLAKIGSGSEEGDKARKGNGEFGNEDIVDVLLRLQETGELQFPIKKEDIKAVVYDMFSAGTETSSTAMDWAMAELMRTPGAMAKAQAEVRRVFNDTTIMAMGDNDPNLKYLKLVIREALRMHPPVPILPRASREERVIDGYVIPANVKVLVNNWGMQRDPAYWTNPDSFEPERFEECSKEFLGADFDFLPFGAGKRMCPGITFAMASVELVLAQLLYHFDWKLPNGAQPESLDMIENPGVTASRRDSLLAIPTPYKNSA
ncbi:premnaspirodiene oxygenase-like [Salvia hispanica]|uniref:premnaspirodiene oxygenase-like n=1 Tax=Salvia hispanica TaxID=49212 RepID=UPI002009365C|nr:premnaspirodiene oxygenase-like [Salvia hispanica]